MNITIYHNGANAGPYTMEQVIRLVAQQRLSHRDLAWVDGAANWQPVENLIMQDSFRRQREAYVASGQSTPDKKGPKKSRHAKRWLWKP